MAEKEPSYDVGYGKPPRTTQFAKGKSGNPRGRPKGSKNIATLIREIAEEQVVVVVNGKKKRMSKLAAVITQAVNQGLSGDQKAAREMREWIRTFPEKEDELLALSTPHERDEVVLKGLQERLARLADQDPTIEEPNQEPDKENSDG